MKFIFLLLIDGLHNPWIVIRKLSPGKSLKIPIIRFSGNLCFLRRNVRIIVTFFHHLFTCRYCMPTFFQKNLKEELGEHGFLLQNSNAAKKIGKIKTIMFDVGPGVLLSRKSFVLSTYLPASRLLIRDINHPELQTLRTLLAQIPASTWDSRCHEDALTEYVVMNETYQLDKNKSDDKRLFKILTPDNQTTSIIIDQRKSHSATHRMNEKGEIVPLSVDDKSDYVKAIKEMQESLGCLFFASIYQLYPADEISEVDGNVNNSEEMEERVVMLGVLGFGPRVIPEALEMLHLLQHARFRILPVSSCDKETFLRVLKLCDFGDPEYFFSGNPLVGKVEETCQGLYDVPPVTKTWITEVIDRLGPVLYLGTSLSDAEAVKISSVGLCVRRNDQSQVLQNHADVVQVDNISTTELSSIVELLTVGRHKAFRRRRKSQQELVSPKLHHPLRRRKTSTNSV